MTDTPSKGPLRIAHIRILLVASLGQFLGQGLATLVGIVIPLLKLASSGLPSGLEGILGCISLIGIMIGSAVIGNLSDRLGSRMLFRLCPLVCGLSALAVVLFPHVYVLLVCLFIMGFAVGGEYSLDPNYISALMPQQWKLYMVGVAKALASVGSAFVAIICYIVLRHGAEPRMWSGLMWIIVGLCTLMVLLRLQCPPVPNSTKAPALSITQFVRTRLRKVIFTGVPWACEGLGVYGIGIFLPVLVLAFHLDSASSTATQMDAITASVELTFVLCVVMMAGFATGLLALRRLSHVTMQIWGFWISVAGLGLLLATYLLRWPSAIAIAGFVIFELALNAGPHLITFILPSQVFDGNDRGTGAGIAASVGKAGAVVGAFCIPVILHQWGATGVLVVSIIVMALGAVITRIFRP